MTRNVIYDTHQISESLLVLYPDCTTCIIFLCHHFLFSHVHSSISSSSFSKSINYPCYRKSINHVCQFTNFWVVYYGLTSIFLSSINARKWKKWQYRNYKKISLIKTKLTRQRISTSFFYMQTVFATKSLEITNLMSANAFYILCQDRDIIDSRLCKTIPLASK